jgi:alkyl hydroperoxide reductase subunit AhpC
LADFQGVLNEYRQADVGVAAGSVDPEAKASQLVNQLGLEFPVGHGLDLDAWAQKLGVYYEPEKQYFHAAGFLLRPTGEVEVACYSSGPVGRMAAGNTLQLIKHYQSRKNE